MIAERDSSYSQKRLVDLCRDNEIRSIKCDAPSSEGHEVTNLIDNNFVIKSKGFLAERFIKPPVTITSEFSSSVQLSYIVINCQVGAQRTMGIELLCKTNRTEDKFESIGSGLLPEDKIGFVFHRYNHNVTNSLGGQYLYKAFRSSRHLSFVHSFKIKIFRTSGCSVPALGKLEIWGNPFKFMQHTKRTVDIKSSSIPSSPKDDRNLQDLMLVGVPKGQHSNKMPLLAHQSTSNILQSSENELQIPDEFNDPITCEIMSQPLIMPSGKIIDNTTLESYIKAEEKWGRGPNDPFTGVLFTTFSKPVVASDLKIRIDRFLSKNSHNNKLFGIPRTIGRSWSSSSGKESKPSVSNLVCIAKANSSLLVDLNESSSITATNIVDVHQPPAKRQKREAIMHGSATVINVTESSSNLSKNTNSSGKNLKPLSFQEMMEQSLEFSLKKTLSQLPKLTSTKMCSNTEKILLECHMCNFKNDLFSISCTHYICRKCLISSKTNDISKCNICNSPFKSSDAVKIHLPTKISRTS